METAVCTSELGLCCLSMSTMTHTSPPKSASLGSLLTIQKLNLWHLFSQLSAAHGPLSCSITEPQTVSSPQLTNIRSLPHTLPDEASHVVSRLQSLSTAPWRPCLVSHSWPSPVGQQSQVNSPREAWPEPGGHALLRGKPLPHTVWGHTDPTEGGDPPPREEHSAPRARASPAPPHLPLHTG